MQERVIRMVRSKKWRLSKLYTKYRPFQMQLTEWDGKLEDALFFDCIHNMESFNLGTLIVLRDFLSEIIAEYQPEEDE